MAVTSKVHKFKAQTRRLIRVPPAPPTNYLYTPFLFHSIGQVVRQSVSQPVDQLLISETVAMWVGWSVGLFGLYGFRSCSMRAHFYKAINRAYFIAFAHKTQRQTLSMSFASFPAPASASLSLYLFLPRLSRSIVLECLAGEVL